MNYYEHHLGDYAEATAHLTFVEDAAYSRLLRKYYATEQPLPADLKAVQRLVGARSKEEREAVEVVLNEFFTLQSDGWHNARCDEEIARFHESAPEREAKKANAKERKERYRQRRAEVFEQLRQHGIVPPFETPMAELNRMLERVLGNAKEREGTEHGTRSGTATQSPDASPQSPEDQKLSPSGVEVGKPTPPPADLVQPKAERYREITEDARLAFNAKLGKPNGLLASVRLLTDVRVKEVKRCLPVAREICRQQYGSDRITAEFWGDYFDAVAADDFHAGRVPGGPGHEGWQPDFEYLTRPAVMAKLFDRALADEPQAGVA